MKVEVFSWWGIGAAVIMSAAVCGIYFIEPSLIFRLVGETGVIERSTALFYALAGCAALVAALSGSGFLRFFAIGWLALSILSFGEETSWLQHEIGYSTPEFLRDRNVQGEVNLHNLRGLHGGKLLGKDDVAPALGGLASVQNLFQLGFFLFFAALPMLATVGPRALQRQLVRWQLPFPGPRMALMIWLPIGVAVALALVTTGLVKDFAAEVREMLYAMAFLLFLAGLAIKLWQMPAKIGCEDSIS